jgi:hypothetical protein
MNLVQEFQLVVLKIAQRVVSRFILRKPVQHHHLRANSLPKLFDAPGDHSRGLSMQSRILYFNCIYLYCYACRICVSLEMLDFCRKFSTPA